jgi:hypothetical protein
MTDDLDLERIRTHADRLLLELSAQMYCAWLVLEAKGELEYSDTLADLLYRNETFLRERISASRKAPKA